MCIIQLKIGYATKAAIFQYKTMRKFCRYKYIFVATIDISFKGANENLSDCPKSDLFTPQSLSPDWPRQVSQKTSEVGVSFVKICAIRGLFLKIQEVIRGLGRKPHCE